MVMTMKKLRYRGTTRAHPRAGGGVYRDEDRQRTRTAVADGRWAVNVPEMVVVCSGERV